MQPKTDQKAAVLADRADQNDEGNLCMSRCAAVAMMLGPGAAMGFYASMSGYYIEAFDRPDFFIRMLAAVLFPGALVSLLQYQFDAYFDRLFSTGRAFFVRVVVLQVVLAGVGILWIVRPRCSQTTLIVGVLLGFVSLAIVSSATQMVAAMDPQLTVYSTIGRMLGSLVPVIVFYVLGFQPDSSMAMFRSAVAIVPVLCIACTLFLSWLHATSDVLQRSYDRLSYDLWHVPADLSLAEKHEASAQATDTEGGSAQNLLARQSSEVAPLLGDADGMPVWIWVWCAYTGLSVMLSVSVFGVVGFFGDPVLAQSLSLAKIVTEFAGTFLSMPLPQFPSFKEGPWHKLLVAGGLSYVALWVTLIHKLFHHSGDDPTLLLAWLGFYLIHSSLMPHIAVTIGSFVSVKDRKSVLRANVACQNLGLVAGVSITFAISMPVLANSPAMALLHHYAL